MITIQDWFNKKSTKPFIFILVSIVILQTVFLTYLQHQNIKTENGTVRNIAAMASFGIQKQDRNIIDMAITMGHKELKTNSILLCRNDKSIIKHGDISLNCKTTQRNLHLLDRLVYVNATGMPHYKFIFILPRFNKMSGPATMAIISIAFIFLCGIILLNIQKQFRAYIINPLIGNSSKKITNHNNIQEIIEILNQRDQLLEMEKQTAIGKLASQVSHDIRSPLTALNMAVRRISTSLEEEDRILIRTQIQRIKDIANNLLVKKKQNTESTTKQKDETNLCPQLLYSIIDEIITEKRMSFRDLLGINIESNIDNTYGLFANINSSGLKRVISNLINNATEAYGDKKGSIVVHLLEDSNNARIIVEDFGKGIPKHLISKLGQEGASFGKKGSKESGSGIGLHHAISTIESFGGTLKIDSIECKGTKIIISLPLTQSPHWFVPKLSVENGQNIVILDDDQGIHTTWDNRFKEVLPKDNAISIVHVSNPIEFTKWIESNPNKKEKTLYLCDLELIGHKQNGLDLIEQHKLQNAILVTSHYEERKVRQKCKNLNVKLVPKMLAGLVPINYQHKVIESNSELTTPASEYDAIFIDDDKYIRMDWNRYAKKNKIKLLAFSSTKDFLEKESTFNKENIDIYIDRELGENEPKGEDFAQELFNRGFKKLHMATGHSPDMFSHLTFLKGIVGKEPFGVDEDDW